MTSEKERSSPPSLLYETLFLSGDGLWAPMHAIEGIHTTVGLCITSSWSTNRNTRSEAAGTCLSISDGRLEIDTAGVELMLSYDNPRRPLPEWKDNTTGLQRQYCTRRRPPYTSTSPFRTQSFALRLCDYVNKLADGQLAPVT